MDKDTESKTSGSVPKSTIDVNNELDLVSGTLKTTEDFVSDVEANVNKSTLSYVPNVMPGLGLTQTETSARFTSTTSTQPSSETGIRRSLQNEFNNVATKERSTLTQQRIGQHYLAEYVSDDEMNAMVVEDNRLEREVTSLLNPQNQRDTQLEREQMETAMRQQFQEFLEWQRMVKGNVGNTTTNTTNTTNTNASTISSTTQGGIGSSETTPVSRERQPAHQVTIELPQTVERQSLEGFPSLRTTNQRLRNDERISKEVELKQKELDRIRHEKRKLENDIPWKIIGKLPEFSGKMEENVQVFIKNLERTFQRGRVVTNEAKAMVAMLGLKGNALDWSSTLPYDSTQSYAVLRMALLKQFWTEAHQQTAREQFEKLKIQEGEDVLSYHLRVSTIAEAISSDYDKVNERDIFIRMRNGISGTNWDEEYRRYNMMQGGERRSLSDFIRTLNLIAASFPLVKYNEQKEKVFYVNQDRKNKITCGFCKRLGHKESECMTKKRNEKPATLTGSPMKKFRSPDRPKENKDETPKSSKYKKEKRTCYKCQKRGHLAKDCTEINSETKVNKTEDSAYDGCDFVNLVEESNSFGVVKINLRIGNRKTNCIIDSGCKQVLVSEESFRKLKSINTKLKTNNLRLAGANNSSLEVIGTVQLPLIVQENILVYNSWSNEDKEIVNTVKDIENSNPCQETEIEGSDREFYVDFTVVRNLATECIIGTSVWSKLGIVINSKKMYLEICRRRIPLANNNAFFVKKTSVEPNSVCWVTCQGNTRKAINIEGGIISRRAMVIPGVVQPDENGKFDVLIWNFDKEINLEVEPNEVVMNINSEFSEILEDEHFSLKQLTIGCKNPKRISKVKRLLIRYKDCFREWTKPGEQYNGEEASFNLKENAIPQVDKLYSRRPNEHQIIEKEIQKLMDRDLIEKSNSAWRANTLLVKKKDGSTRFTVDYRLLNTQSEILAFPMPLIQEIISNLYGKKFISKVDFCDGFWAIKLKEESRPLTGFGTRDRQYQWKVCPQGYSGSPALFQRAVNETLGDMMWKSAMPYIDDIIIVSESFKQHLKDLEELFTRLKKANFFLKLRKCEFLMKDMEYLGHMISEDGVRPSKEKVQAVLNMPVPKNDKSVKRFLGLGSFYRKYILHFAQRTTNMRKLVKKDAKFIWTKECQEELDDIKSALTNDPVMAFPDWTREFIITTDASILGLGGILSQIYPEGERVIEYASRATTDTESRYGISELECLAVMWAVDKFGMYIRNSKFTLVTDHRALTSIKTIKQNNPRLHRWSIKLADMNYDIVYRPGVTLTNADPLSREVQEVVALIKEAQNFYTKKVNQFIAEGAVEVNVETDERQLILRKNRVEWILKGDYTLWLRENWNEHERKVLINVEDVREVLASVHNNGHFGYKKCYYYIKRNYFWHGMKKDVDLFCKSCELCQCRILQRRNVGGGLGRIIATRKNELIGIDLFSGVPESAVGGYKYVLVMTDYVTKYTMATPLMNKKAITVAMALYDKWCTVFGFPEKIQSDKGKEFVSKLSKAFYKVFEIKKVQTSGWHPQANGQVERFNKTMANMLAKLCANDQVNWPTYLNTVIIEYNAMVHASTGESPFFLMFGRDFRFPLEIKHATGIGTNYEWKSSNLSDIAERVKKACERNNLRFRQNAALYNKKRIPHLLKIGDLVMEVTMPATNKEKHLHKKLRLPGKGPYKISDISKDDNTVKLVETEGTGGNDTWVVNVARVKKYVARPQWMIDPNEPTVLEITGPNNIDEHFMEVEENADDGTEDNELPAMEQIHKEISDHFKKTEKDLCIRNSDLDVTNLKVDALVNNQWKCGILLKTKKQGGLAAKVVGKFINAWIPVNRLRRCECDEPSNKKATDKDLKRVKHKKYWKVE